jgi:hypothetical protein
MTSDLQLKRFYNKLNATYYAGELEDVAIWWEPVAGGIAECQRMGDGEMVIRIDPCLRGKKSLWKMAVIHETVHVRLDPHQNHGRKFNAEMLRLAELGAMNGIW